MCHRSFLIPRLWLTSAPRFKARSTARFAALNCRDRMRTGTSASQLAGADGSIERASSIDSIAARALSKSKLADALSRRTSWRTDAGRSFRLKSDSSKTSLCFPCAQVRLSQQGDQFCTADAKIKGLLQRNLCADNIPISHQCLAKQQLNRKHLFINLKRVLQLNNAAVNIFLLVPGQRILVIPRGLGIGGGAVRCCEQTRRRQNYEGQCAALGCNCFFGNLFFSTLKLLRAMVYPNANVPAEKCIAPI